MKSPASHIIFFFILLYRFIAINLNNKVNEVLCSWKFIYERLTNCEMAG
jgi:hypothetical protein